MKVVAFCGYSGAGKTTLLEQLIARFKHGGARVSVIKHAHHDFEIDHEGKDSWRHRRAGAYEVLVASDRRLAKIREYEVQADPSVHALIAELDACDWVLVEGYKHAELPKLEIWRVGRDKAPRYAEDRDVVAVVTDDRALLPAPLPEGMPVLDLNDADAVYDHLLQTAPRYEYIRPDDAAT